MKLWKETFLDDLFFDQHLDDIKSADNFDLKDALEEMETEVEP
jgi:hypothetical protein